MTYGRKSYEKQKTLLGAWLNSMYLLWQDAVPVEALIPKKVPAKRQTAAQRQMQMQAEPLPTKK